MEEERTLQAEGKRALQGALARRAQELHLDEGTHISAVRELTETDVRDAWRMGAAERKDGKSSRVGSPSRRVRDGEATAERGTRRGVRCQDTGAQSRRPKNKTRAKRTLARVTPLRPPIGSVSLKNVSRRYGRGERASGQERKTTRGWYQTPKRQGRHCKQLVAGEID